MRLAFFLSAMPLRPKLMLDKMHRPAVQYTYRGIVYLRDLPVMIQIFPYPKGKHAQENGIIVYRKVRKD
jgi:hypothetical protein